MALDAPESAAAGPRIRSLPPGEVPGWMDALGVAYAATFRGPPWNETAAESAEFRARLPEHLGAPGWRCQVAEQDGTVLGFAYGVDTPDPFPDDGRYLRVRAAVGPQRAADLAGALEVVELAVVPAALDAGLNRRLLDALLDPVPPRVAWLLTVAPAAAAARLYQGAGWRLIGTEVGAGLRVYRSPGF
jgi:GNAT superfamily N-acetyltransferase